MPSRVLTLGVLLLTCSLLTHCGYQLGTAKPAELADVQRIYISLPDNRTQQPQLEAKLANFLTDTLIEDGQYAASSLEDADAELVTSIRDIGYRQSRSTRTDAIRPEELLMNVKVDWEIRSLRSSSTEVLLSGSETGTTRFFLENNLQAAQRNAFPDALLRVSRRIIFSLSNAL